VPDPDATPVAPTQESYPPRQLQPQPQDQVASLRTGQRWAVTTITWPAPQGRVEAAGDRVPVVSPRDELRSLDESGWRSVGK